MIFGMQHLEETVRKCL